MILSQNLTCTVQIKIVLGQLAPGQLKECFHVGADQRGLGISRRHLGKMINLLTGSVPCLIVHGRFFELLEQVLVGRAVIISKLGLNGLDLLPEEILFLILLHLLTDTALNLMGKRGKLCFRLQNGADLFKPFPVIKDFKNRLPVIHLADHVGRDHISQHAGICDLHDGIIAALIKAVSLIIEGLKIFPGRHDHGLGKLWILHRDGIKRLQLAAHIRLKVAH